MSNLQAIAKRWIDAYMRNYLFFVPHEGAVWWKLLEELEITQEKRLPADYIFPEFSDKPEEQEFVVNTLKMTHNQFWKTETLAEAAKRFEASRERLSAMLMAQK